MHVGGVMEDVVMCKCINCKWCCWVLRCFCVMKEEQLNKVVSTATVIVGCILWKKGDVLRRSLLALSW
jgi:hypothetical protein